MVGIERVLSIKATNFAVPETQGYTYITSEQKKSLWLSLHPTLGFMTYILTSSRESYFHPKIY